MSKKVQPDPKTRTIQHINGTKEEAKEYAYLKSKHVVDTSTSNNTFGNITIEFTSPTPTNEYKLTNHEGSGDDGE